MHEPAHPYRSRDREGVEAEWERILAAKHQVWDSVSNTAYVNHLRCEMRQLVSSRRAPNVVRLQRAQV